MALAPGAIRDPIISYLSAIDRDATLAEICSAVRHSAGEVSESSVRSSLNLNTPGNFERVSRGRYRLRKHTLASPEVAHAPSAMYEIGKATLYHSDCFTWLSRQSPNSVHAVITDPPYGLKEFSEKETSKLRSGKGGVWRVPPSFDGHQRSPLPRFTILSPDEKKEIEVFFKNLGQLLLRVLVPGANVAVASNPLLAHIVSDALAVSGFEVRGSLVRLTMTMRGGDRPKNAHVEYAGVSVMPRSMWEPWVLLRKPVEGRIQDNLRKWKTGGWRRPDASKPFGDVIESSPTHAKERRIAPHPALKPQALMRRLVRASLPLGEGVVLDPFCGAGSTLAAANCLGYSSIGLEKDPTYLAMARRAIPQLSALHTI